MVAVAEGPALSDPLAPDRAVQDHLIIPSMPTPNGRLHLGHIAGPFLRADVLARHLRRRGDRVRVISGFDSFESYMMLQAAREGIGPADVARRYGPGIAHDLRLMHIEIDCWIDPLDPAWSDRYLAAQRGLIESVLLSSRAEPTTETVGYLPASGRYLVGCWLSGRCPECGELVAGYSCESCGANFQPWQVLDPAPRPPFEGTPEPRTLRSPFLVVRDDPEILAWLGRADLDEPVRRRVARAFAGRTHYVRLAAPGDWGVPMPMEMPGGGLAPGVLFTYTFNAAYCLLIGDTYRALESQGGNPFDAESPVRITATFGMDVMLTKLINVPAVLFARGELRPFDRACVNQFYLLSGEKFSTSRRHAIWVEEIATRTPASADVIRFHLARTSPGRETANFDPTEFLAGTVELARRVGQPVLAATRTASATTPTDPPAALVARLSEELVMQADALDHEPLEVAQVADSVLRWADLAPAAAAGPERSNEAYWWLRGLALVSYPIMPEFATRLWHAGGQPGAPAIAEWWRRETFSEPWRADPFPVLQAADLAPCLPSQPRST